MPAMPITDEVGERRERCGAFAGAQRRDQERGVALIEERRCALLVRVQRACAYLFKCRLLPAVITTINLGRR